MSKLKELSDKHKLFIAEYIKNNCNGTKAYMSVYDVESPTARANAAALLANPSIKEAVNDEIDKILNEKKELTLQVLNEYKKIAFSDISNYVNPTTGENKATDEIDTSVIKSVQFDTLVSEKKGYEKNRFKIELYNKQAALDSISKLILGLSEKRELGLTGKDGEDLFGVFKKNLQEQ